MAFHKAANNFTVTLDGDITGTATSADVTGSLSAISSILPVYLTIENEIVEVTAVVSQTLTMVRGTQGSSGVPHTSGTNLDLNITADQINELIDDKQDTGGSVFGTEYAYFNKVGDESSASTIPVIYHSVTTPVLPAGTYLLNNFASIAAGSPSQIMFAQVTVDGNISTYTQYEPKDANNQESWTPFNQFTLLSNNSVTINLEYGKVSGAAAVLIKESRISYWRVN